MHKKSLFRRYVFFIVGLFIMALGVALSVQAALGTSPISSLPYVLSLALPITMGQITIIMHIVFLLFQILLLRQDFERIQLLQLAVACLFGVFTDVTLFSVSWLHPSTYATQIVCLILSCVLVALGVSMEVSANVLMLAGEGLVTAIMRVSQKKFGDIKVMFDSALVFTGGLCSFIVFKHVHGIREGTIIAACSVGILSRILVPKTQQILERYLAL